VPSGNLLWGSVAEIVQQQLKPLGIEVSIVKKEIGDFKQSFLDFKYQLMVNNAINDISDPDEMASFQVDTDNGGSGSFWTNYRNPQAIALVRRAETEFNAAKRRQLDSRIQAIVAQDAPYVPLYYPPYIWALRDKVQGFAVNPGGAYRLEDVWLK
jgi:peptide/nickel transport system substrate-binding protein